MHEEAADACRKAVSRNTPTIVTVGANKWKLRSSIVGRSARRLRVGGKNSRGISPDREGGQAKEADRAGQPLREIAAGLLAERLYGGRFFVFYVENSVELGDLEQVVNFLGEVEQLEFAALVFDGGVGADQLADA
jgi:hypothetical protein